MPQRPARFYYACFALLLLFLAGCGSSSSNSNTVSDFELGTAQTGVFAQVTTAQSIQQTQVVQLTTQSKNSKGAILFPVVTWSSSNPSIASVSGTGEVCAGTWDANFINCTPGPTGSATITATAQGKTASLTFNIHARIASVTLGPPQSSCASQTQTSQYTFHAFDASQNDITSQVGTPNFTTSDASVATVDANGLTTARNSGATIVTASIGGISSPPSIFVTCPPASIVLHKSGDPAGTTTTTFPLTVGGAATLVADVTDTKGNPVAGLALTFFSNQPAAVSVSGAIITGSDVGIATIGASCTPPGCNPSNNLGIAGTGVPVYSNLVNATVTGTAAASTVYVTGVNAADGTATNTTLLPIPTATNTPGTAITLPGVPISMAVSPKGDKVFVTTPAGLTTIATSSNTITGTNATAVGKIIGINKAGTQVVTFDAPNSRVLLFDTASTSATFVQNANNAPSADFSPDGYKLFVAADNQVVEYTISPGVAHRTPFAATPTSVAALPQGVAAYASPFNTGQIASIATCNNSTLTTPSLAPPQFLSASPDATELIGLSSASWITLAYTVASGACPPIIHDASGANSFAYGGPAPTSLIVSPTQNFAVATANNAAPTANLNFLNLQTNTSGTAPLSNGATGTFTSGGFTLDGTSFYVGIAGGTAGNSVHRFDTTGATPADATTITVTFRPDFVVVKP
ncbi:MAG: hypothetical protein NVS9B15_10380 [Acidobacteriaceae bacterium]